MGETNQTERKIYIEGQQIEGIPEIQEVEPIDEPPAVVLPVEPAEFTGTLILTAEQQAAIEKVTKLLRETWEAVKKVLDKAVEVLQPIWERLVETYRDAKVCAYKGVRDALDALLYAANDNPKWWHIYTHTKKRRTRKKYRDKLMRQLVVKLATAKE